ncbi:MAG: EAL domain-containing protein [Burkholderiales bacterium]|nr:EAL domain-containing protein [Burkholderiales bacterium]
MTRPAPPPPGPQFDTRRGVLGVVLLYASFATLWILLSDRVVEWLFRDAEAIMLASIFKGWFFVAVTSALLYWLLRIRPVPLTAQPRPTRIRRVPLALLALLTATIVTLVVLTVWYGLREEKEKAYAQLLAISESKAREIWTWHKERLSDASWANKAPYLRNQWLSWRTEGNVAAGRTLQAFLKSYVSDAAFPRMEIVDAQGHKVLDSNDPDLLPVNPESAPFVDPTLHLAVLRALTLGEPMRAGPWRDATGTLRLAFVGPLAGETAHPAALVLHIDPPEYLHPALTDWPLPQKSAEAFLFRQDNDQLLFLSELRHRKDAALQLRLPVTGGDQLSAQVLRSDVAPGVLIEGLDYRNVPTYGVAQRIGDTEWWLMTKQDRAELLQIALVRSAWMVLAGALALLAVGGALYLHNERLRLQDSAREIEELRRIEHSLSESEAQYRLLAENSSDVVWLYDLVNQRFLYASPSIEDLLGYTVSETLKLSMRDVVSPEMYPVTVARIKARVDAFLAGDEHARTQTLESVNLHRDGRHIPVEAVSTLLADERGQITRMLGVSRDISERKKSQAQLLQLSQAIEQSPAAVIITGLDGNIEYVNQAFVATSGYQRHEVLGENPRMLRSGRTPPEVYASMWFTLNAGQPWHGEMINRHKSGREYVQSMNLAPVRDAQGQVTHYLAVQLDVTAQKDAEDKAHQLAWFNPLTGLPNRHRLLQDIQDVLDAHGRTHEQCALLLLNLDRFQTVNDALGHSAGDQLLKKVGERLADLLHVDDRLAHLSADEFAILLHGGDTGSEGTSALALRLAQTLQERLDQPFELESAVALKISCCVGITLLPQGPGDSPGDVLRRADTALHRAKDGGAGQAAFFDVSMEQLISRRFLIERDLRRGLAANELRLYLQPQVNAQGRVVGAEALVRWLHPEHGLMAPGTFIPIAEESELITELGRWVLKTVCRHLGELRRDGLRLPIAVNISPRQFHQPGFVHVVQDTLMAQGAAPDDLVIEITESIVMDQMDSVVQKMSHLTSLGVKFSLDDFGTGYSSLAYLKRLPIHELKIDRSFVQDAPTDPSDAALVEAILSVARHMRLKVVAEGVETVEQSDFLNARGQVIQQGYLHGRPAPADEVLARWRQSQQAETQQPPA